MFFFQGNVNMDLHFISFLHIEVTDAVEILNWHVEAWALFYYSNTMLSQEF